MDEADRVATRIAVIDHGKIVAIGSSQALKAQTQTETLEAAFLKLTGTAIRDETVGVGAALTMVGAWRFSKIEV
jgi:ABC-2 type transport system ATP-binding protein